MLRRALFPLLLGLPACKNDQTVQALHPEIVVTPTALDFEGVVVDYSLAKEIQIFNAGRKTLEIDEIVIEGEDALAFVVGMKPATVEPDQVGLLSIEFWPETYVTYDATVLIRSNDEESAEVAVTLAGEGIPAPTPDILVSTTVLDFDLVTVGDHEVEWFSVANVGDDTLVIGETVQSGAGTFRITGDPLGTTLGPGETTQVIVEYEPTWEDGDNGTFTIHSNDPDEPEVTVVLLGNGGGTFQYPVAVIEGPTDAEPLDTITLDGTQSYDPTGLEPLTYEWTVVTRPGGATSEPNDPAASSTSLWLHKAGTWVVELRVKNTLGVESAPDKLTIDVEPQDQIWVELTWNTGDTDLDLHLAQEGVPLYGDSDTNWCNPSPDWGTVGSTADDPELALDNVLGLGPEDIRIDEPGDGNYYVRVHYYDDYGGATTTATVDIWLDGVLADSQSAQMVRNNMWEVGYIRWPEALFVPDGTVLDDAPARTCP